MRNLIIAIIIAILAAITIAFAVSQTASAHEGDEFAFALDHSGNSRYDKFQNRKAGRNAEKMAAKRSCVTARASYNMANFHLNKRHYNKDNARWWARHGNNALKRCP